MHCRPTTVEELKEYRPSLGQNLQDMVAYKNDDFEDIYDLSFAVSNRYILVCDLICIHVCARLSVVYCPITP